MKKLFVLLLSLVVISACGVASKDQSGGQSAGLGKVSMFVTDDLSTAYKEVWVTLHKVEVKSEQQSYELFNSEAGEVINLSELAGIGSLLNISSLPAGSYSHFEIKLAREVTLVALDGTQQTVSFAKAGDKEFVNIDVHGELVIVAGASSSFALDFDLSKFVVNQDNEIVAHVRYVRDVFKEMREHIADVKGEVTAVAENSFTLKLMRSDEELQVAYNELTLMRGADDQALTTITVGMRLKVYGEFNEDLTVLNAIKIVERDMDEATDANIVELKGIIESVSNKELVLNVMQSDVVPGSDLVTIALTELTRYYSGDSSTLTEGQEVEIKARVGDDGSYTALRVSIEGAGCDDHAGDAYVEARAKVISLTDDTLLVEIIATPYKQWQTGQQLSLDISGVYIRHGSRDQLIADAEVAIKGTVNDAGEFVLRVIKLAYEGSELFAKLAEIKGLVISVDTESMLVKVNRIRPVNENLMGQELVVKFIDSTLFAGGMQPVVNNRVEVYAVMEGEDYIARMVKVDQHMDPAGMQ